VRRHEHEHLPAIVRAARTPRAARIRQDLPKAPGTGFLRRRLLAHRRTRRARRGHRRGLERREIFPEIKTTKAGSVYLGRKDVTGLASRQKDGYRPVIGVLRLSPLSNWIVADAEGMAPRKWPIDSMSPYRLTNLERLLCPLFDSVLELHAQPTLDGSQMYLDDVLRACGATVGADDC
jgi:hypothetical protein